MKVAATRPVRRQLVRDLDFTARVHPALAFATIDHDRYRVGASWDTLLSRLWYGGRKGRRAYARIERIVLEAMRTQGVS